MSSSVTRPTFKLRIWADQTLYASRDYTITADSLEAAATLLWSAQMAAENNDAPVSHPDVEPFFRFDKTVDPLDPTHIIDSTYGIYHLDDSGGVMRDLTGTFDEDVEFVDPNGDDETDTDHGSEEQETE